MARLGEVYPKRGKSTIQDTPQAEAVAAGRQQAGSRQKSSFRHRARKNSRGERVVLVEQGKMNKLGHQRWPRAGGNGRRETGGMKVKRKEALDGYF